MINFAVPVNEGLDAVVDVIVRSDDPACEAFRTFGLHLLPQDLIQFRGAPHDSVTAMVDELEEENRTHGYGPFLRMASTFFNADQDYLTADPEELREAFLLGGQSYNVLTSNGCNTSFAIDLYPKETVTNPEKEDMLTGYCDDRFRDSISFVTMKTLLMCYTSKEQPDESHYALVSLPGDAKVIWNRIRKSLKQNGVDLHNVKIAQADPSELIGRPQGAVSPLFQQGYFSNIGFLFIDESLMETYSAPHYSVVMDKRSSLVVSSMDVLLGSLQRFENYPKVVIGNYAKPLESLTRASTN